MKGYIINGKKIAFPYGVHTPTQLAENMEDSIKKITGTVLGTPKCLNAMNKRIKLLNSTSVVTY